MWRLSLPISQAPTNCLKFCAKSKLSDWKFDMLALATLLCLSQQLLMKPTGNIMLMEVMHQSIPAVHIPSPPPPPFPGHCHGHFSMLSILGMEHISFLCGIWWPCAFHLTTLSLAFNDKFIGNENKLIATSKEDKKQMVHVDPQNKQSLKQ